MSNQGTVQTSVRTRHAQAGNRDWNGDWMELFDREAIPGGTFNERMLRWINVQLSPVVHTSVPGAMQAYATFRSAYNWSSMTSIAAS